MKTQLDQRFNQVQAEQKATEEKLATLNNELMRLNLHKQILGNGLNTSQPSWFVVGGQVRSR